MMMKKSTREDLCCYFQNDFWRFSPLLLRTISQPNEWKNIGNLILSDAYQNCKKLAGGIVAEEKEQMLFSTRIFLLITFWRYHSTFCKNGYFTETVPFRHFIGNAEMHMKSDKVINILKFLYIFQLVVMYLFMKKSAGI